MYEMFEAFKRGSRTIDEYIAQFELLISKLQKHGIEVPGALLACKLLYAAEIDKRDTRLVISATEA